MSLSRFTPAPALACAALLAFAFAPSAQPQTAQLHLLQKPAISKDKIVFTYSGDLWSVPREGGQANRLTSGLGFETNAYFSPDGKTLAFSGQYDGNTDVFTLPVEGGIPKRVTYHPAADYVAGWSPDGRILFRSDRTSHSRYTELFTVSPDGGLPQTLPLPMACMGAFSPDGKRLVYAPIDGNQFATGFSNFVSWKRYRGGEASYLWIVNLADLTTVKVPRTDSNDIYPMWIGAKIYFLSDRDGPMTLFEFDPASNKVSKLVSNTGNFRDIMSASAGPDRTIVYEQFGQIHVYDIATAKQHEVPVQIATDLSEVRPRFRNVAPQITSARISPTGARAVFEAHGEILTVPADKGDIRNITNSPGVMDRTPSWSPDGKSIAWFSDESGEYALHVKAQTGDGETRRIPLAGNSAFYFKPAWSPDSKHLAFHDNQLNIWEVNVETGKFTKVDSDRINENEGNVDFAWSGDSKWLAYTHGLTNRLNALFIWSVETGTTQQITDGMSNVLHPAFDRDGQYLYFTASTNYGPTVSGLDMSSDEHRVTSTIYLAVLANNVASPLVPQSDEEAAKPADPPVTPNAAETAPKPVRIDFDGLRQRIVPLPLPAREYTSLRAGKPGILFIVEDTSNGFRGPGGGGLTLIRYDLKTRKQETLSTGIRSFDLSASGDKMLLRMAPPGAAGAEAPVPGVPAQYVIAASNVPVKAGEGVLKLTDVQVRVDPVAEWKQMYREVWRIEKSYFYDPGLHGLNIADQEKAYEKYLDSLSSRADLNYLFHDMLSDITVGHLRGGGGNIPTAPAIPGGLLGADYEIASGRYKIARIYTGENWNPQVTGPLATPGLSVTPGTFILAINGQDLTAKDDISRLLENTAGKRTSVKIATDAAGSGARDIVVTPVRSETQLRHVSWVEKNRLFVDKLSGGKLAYVFMPDTAEDGLTSFTRYYFAQTDKSGVVLDERFNGGGQVADYVIEVLNRQLLGWWSPRYGDIYRSPAAAVLGPRVMVTNEMSGSGGDMMPWMFHYTKTGTLVGKRTWGGLVGIQQYPTLMDGGNVTAPSFGFFNPANQWDVENKGVAPDVEIDQDPRAVHDGHDPQLERAVAIALDELTKHPVPTPKRPEYPNYQRK